MVALEVTREEYDRLMDVLADTTRPAGNRGYNTRDPRKRHRIVNEYLSGSSVNSITKSIKMTHVSILRVLKEEGVIL